MTYRQVPVTPQQSQTTRQPNSSDTYDFITIMQNNQLKLFKYFNKILLVDEYNYAFMMFEEAKDTTNTGETIKIVNFDFNISIKNLHGAKLIDLNQFPKKNLKYIIFKYLEMKNLKHAKSNSFRFKDISVRYNISVYFARLLYSIYGDERNISNAHSYLCDIGFYLKNHKKLYETLLSGTSKDKKQILLKYLPLKMYTQANIDTLSDHNLDRFVRDYLTSFANSGII